MKFAIVGFGGLGKVHFGNYLKIKEKSAHDVNLVAICDIDPEQFTKAVELNIGATDAPADLSQYNLYTDVDEMLEKEELDFVVTALPTFLHDVIGEKIMNKGIHLFSEKPMALTVERCQKMIDDAKRNNVRLQIGQCCRFETPRENLKKLLDEGKFGKVIRAEFSRFSATPMWCWENWYHDDAKSGGAVLDLHVHDVDCINWLFGKPKSIVAVAGNAKYKYESICSTYKYDDFYVTTMTDWAMCPGSPFVVRGVINCEKATIYMMDDASLKIYPAEGTPYSIECQDDNDMYVKEVVEFIDCVANNRDSDVISPESTLVSVMLANAEKESADKGMPVYLD